jgi:cytochrome c
MRRALVVAVAAWAASASVPRAAAEGSVDHGRALAQANCAGCHAVGPEGESAVPEAPPFRYLKTKYPVDTLAESLAEGIVAGHPGMPEFVFEAGEVEDLLAYLKTL